MIEIIPNWHPVFVHFTVALLSLAVVFHFIHLFIADGNTRQNCYRFAQWNLWLGTGFGIVTAIAGWFASNSVTHDAPSHAAMMEHRNWALATLALFIILAGWSGWKARGNQAPGIIFLVFLLTGGGLLLSTAWHGGELVYRFGLGVMSLPKAGEGDHDHGDHSHPEPTDDNYLPADTNLLPQQEVTDHHHENGDESHETHQDEVVMPEKETTNMDSHNDDEHQHTHNYKENRQE